MRPIGIALLAGLPLAAASASGQNQTSVISFEEDLIPPLMRALYTNKPESVPDTQMVRGYYASIETIFNGSCSENVNPYLAQALNAYLSEHARALQGNASDVAAWAKMLEKAVRNPAGLPLRLAEGEDDARTFLKKHTCQSPEAVTLRKNLHQLVFARKNVLVEPENRARFVAMLNPKYRASLGIELQPVEQTPTEAVMLACASGGPIW